MQHLEEEGIDGVVADRLNAREIYSSHSSQCLEKSGLVRFHYAAAVEFRTFVSEIGSSKTRTFRCALVDPPNSTDSPLETLEKISLRDLDLADFVRSYENKVSIRKFAGRKICGKFCVQPFKIAGVHTVFEEEGGSGAAVLVLIDNAVSSTASHSHIMAKFPEGMKVAIKGPVLRQMWEDGTAGINITNPADIVPLDDSASAVPSSMLSAEFLQQKGILGSSEAFRLLGNAHFAQKKWKKAVEAYKLCAGILEAFEPKSESVPAFDPVIFKEKLTIVYSNKCEALLRLGSYKQALNDAEMSLKLSPNHEKTLLRRARSLQGMQRYEEAIACLELLRSLKPQATSDRLILDKIEAAKVASRQNRSGIYHFEDFIEVMEEKKEAPTCAQFVGPIEIRIGSEHGRRGMFATRDVLPGELLLVSKAIASTEEAEAKGGVRFMYTSGKFISGPGGQAYEAVIQAYNQDLIVRTIARAQESPQVASQLCCLRGGEASNDVPPVTLFTDDWDDEKYPEKIPDVGRIRQVTLTNMFCGGRRLYGLASFFNHSCVPNCKEMAFGEAMLISSTRRIRCGEELTISYFRLCQTLLYRRARMRSRFSPFQCDCPRCKFEEKAYRDVPALGALARTFNQVFEPKSSDDNAAWKNVDRPMVRESAEIAGKVEKILDKSKGCALFRQKQRDCIRCSFYDAYMPAIFEWKPAKKLHLPVDEVLRIVSSVDPGSRGILALAAMGYDGELGDMASSKGSVYFSNLLRQHSTNIYLPVRNKDFETLLKWSRTNRGDV